MLLSGFLSIASTSRVHAPSAQGENGDRVFRSQQIPRRKTNVYVCLLRTCDARDTPKAVVTFLGWLDEVVLEVVQEQ